MLEELIAKVAKMEPLTIALLILLLLAFALYKATPKLMRRGEDIKLFLYNRDGQEVWARRERVEDISSRVHTLTSTVTGLALAKPVTDDRLRTLEIAKDQSQVESGSIKIQIERLAGQVEVGNTQISNLSDRIDQNDEKLSERMDRLDETMGDGLKRVDESLTGLQRAFMERKN